MNYAVAYPRFWLWYFVASVAMALVNSIFTVGQAFGGTGSAGAFGLALEWVSLWPLFGYVRQVRIKPRWLWLAIFIIVATSLVLVVLAVLFITISRSTLLPILYLVPVMALAAPSIFALHQYVFRSQRIWGAT
ncbi:MAG TPA: hypothetical protein PKC80_11730 [Burkholderiaceae bacterium]|nr:hypothetical protein [Burkholderiaceae bacterium]